MAVKIDNGLSFEKEVRQVAEAVWGLEPGACQPAHYDHDPVIRELDGIARTRDASHLLMITTSRKLEKLKDDAKKLHAAENIEKRRSLSVLKWFVTRDQLDAQHIDFARKNGIVALTLEQFKRRFFDGDRYVSLRFNHAFGSARNPKDNSITIPDDAYVPLPMEIEQAGEARRTSVDVEKLCEIIDQGGLVIMMAPFGSGKSLSTREVYRGLLGRYKSQKSSRIPLAINLREHWGQDFSDEILERHARAIGFGRRDDLVIAWRAGMVNLLLDGFDEVASQTIIRLEDRNFMRDARRHALAGVRDFLTKLPSEVGVFLCGRDHYFDTEPELEHALGVSGKRYHIVRLGEFTEQHANEFLKKNGINAEIPDWVPRKPLILSYLVHHDLIQAILNIDGTKGFGYAWNEFITRICHREASLERAVMDPATVRAVLERLAHRVRGAASGIGPITGTNLSEAYNTETGQVAGEGVLAQLQRLPGLTQRDQEAGARSFVDEDMLSALQGSAIARLILGQFTERRVGILAPLSEKALGMASYLLAKNGANSDVAISVADRLAKQDQIGKSYEEKADPQVIADCIGIAIGMEGDKEHPRIDFRHLIVQEGMFGTLNLEEMTIDGLELRSCTIQEIVLGPAAMSSTVRLVGCVITKVSGVATREGLPKHIFGDGCDVEKFDSISINSAVLNSDFDPGTKALLTVLRKLYKQPGAGRKLGALSRGITQPRVLDKIGPIVDLLQKSGMISVFNQVVHPVRKQQGRVEAILTAPAISNDPIVMKAREL